MKIFIYLLVLISPLKFMFVMEHYRWMIKNILTAVIVWGIQLVLLSYYLHFDFYLNFKSDMGVIFLPLLINLFFMVNKWSVASKTED